MPETGAINWLQKSGRDFWLVCHAYLIYQFHYDILASIRTLLCSMRETGRHMTEMIAAYCLFFSFAFSFFIMMATAMNSLSLVTFSHVYFRLQKFLPRRIMEWKMAWEIGFLGLIYGASFWHVCTRPNMCDWPKYGTCNCCENAVSQCKYVHV